MPTGQLRPLLLMVLLVLLLIAVPAYSAPPEDPITPFKERLAEGIPLPLHEPRPAQPVATPPITMQYAPQPNAWAHTVVEGYDVDGRFRIFLLPVTDPDAALRVTTSPGNDLRPRLNHDATQVAFVSDRDGNAEIYRTNIDGSGTTRLTNTPTRDSAPSWSADGRQIVFSSNRDGNYELYQINSDGSNLIRLTNDQADDLMPSWSPDGRTIAWIKRVQTGKTTFERRLWLMGSQGADARAITGPLIFAQNPVWSPDSSRIAFDLDADADGWNELATINADGSGYRVVYDTQTDLQDVWASSWSADSQYLLATVVNFVVRQGYLYVHYAWAERVAFGGDGQRLTHGFLQITLSPDSRTRDPYPPVTRVQPLGSFSRAINIPVTWKGYDRGISGFNAFDVQYRVGSNGGWVDWQMDTRRTTEVYQGKSGTAVSFRSRGRDKAGAHEPWPADGDTTTTLFSWVLDVTAHDSRGRPIPETAIGLAPVVLTPGATDLAGQYRALIGTPGNYTMTAQTPAYGSFPATVLPMVGDQRFNLVIPPSTNLLRNGGFEANSGLPADWQVSGLPVQATSERAHSGSRAVALGTPCPFPCLTASEMLETTPDFALALDANGTLHHAWSVQRYDPPSLSIYHRQRLRGGTWSAAKRVMVGQDVQLALDDNGTLHMLVANAGNGNQLGYAYRPRDGTWSKVLILGNGNEPALGVAPNGHTHITYRCNTDDCDEDETTRYYYRDRPPTGGWSAPLLLAIAQQYGTVYNPTMTVASDSSVHFIWRNILPESRYQLVHYMRRADGGWQPVEEIAPTLGDNLQIAADARGNVYAFWSNLDGSFLARRDAVNSWQIVRMLPQSGVNYLYVEPDGLLHLFVVMNEGNSTKQYYYRQEPDGTWLSGAFLSTETPTEFDFASNGNGAIVLAWDDIWANPKEIRLRETPLATADSRAVLRQQVSIPAGIHRPTLSFQYALERLAFAEGSQFSVTVNDKATEYELFATMAGSGWQHAWADLSDWAGKTVTITFYLHQKQGQPLARLLLDDLTIGAWTTPIIRSAAAPLKGPLGGTTLEIKGENFLQTPRVRLGNTLLTNIRWVNHQTLQATLPPNVRPGRYDLWVTNPDGTRAVLASVPIGREALVPLIRR